MEVARRSANVGLNPTLSAITSAFPTPTRINNVAARPVSAGQPVCDDGIPEQARQMSNPASQSEAIHFQHAGLLQLSQTNGVSCRDPLRPEPNR